MPTIMLIGAGFHARRIYIPYLTRHGSSFPRLSVCVDVAEREGETRTYLSSAGCDAAVVIVPKFNGAQMTAECRHILDSTVITHHVIAVIISTDPVSHRVYAEWALDHGLHILMDKPISTRVNVFSEPTQAGLLRRDFLELLEKYRTLQSHKRTAFTINTQRRYDAGFGKVFDLLQEAKDAFNVPVTSIAAMYADGTWIFPDEYFSDMSHPYCHGYGICSHSGYHIFDIVWQFYLSALIASKAPESMQVYSSFINPSGVNIQLNHGDYKRMFPNSVLNSCSAGYSNRVKHFGEVDCCATVRLMAAGVNICHFTFNLLHNSFSRRSWFSANKDLYKGNGRVKHQQYVIHQGPLQCLHIHNFQSSHLHDIDNRAETDIGGNNHFDIHVFRNADMFGGKNAYHKISTADLYPKSDGGLTIESAKFRVIDEFLGFLVGSVSPQSLRSNIDSHNVPVDIMSGIYMSHSQGRVVDIPISL